MSTYGDVIAWQSQSNTHLLIEADSKNPQNKQSMWIAVVGKASPGKIPSAGWYLWIADCSHRGGIFTYVENSNGKAEYKRPLRPKNMNDLVDN